MDIYTNSEILESFIQEKLEQKKRDLESAAGLASPPKKHFHQPIEYPFTREQRDTTTILFGGLTWKHEHLLKGALSGLGYKCEILPTTDLESYEIGKEYQNNGYCNPSYFTIGNLVKYLQGLEAGGKGRQEIIDNFVFLTARGCGACRFGLYESEYRLALSNAGFDGFRVMTLSVSDGLDQTEVGVQPGLEMNLDFFLVLITAMIIGDILNQIAFQIRPYEVERGRTDQVMQEVINDIYNVFRNRERFESPTVWKRLALARELKGQTTTIAKYLHHLTNPYFVRALNRAQDKFSEIEMDRFRVRPIVKIVGEFWSAFAEGEGNFNMFSFLEGEGAEVHVDHIVGTQIMRILHYFKQSLREKNGLHEWREMPPLWRLDKWLARQIRHQKKVGVLTLAERLYRRETTRFQQAVGSPSHGVCDMYELEQLALPFYNWRCGAGETHLEVAKNIYYHMKDLCHMVLSLKPFGCMPSTQSDGVQALVVELYQDMIFLPIETAGEGEILAHSRVQMAFAGAREKAKREFKTALASTGRSLDKLKAYVDDHPELKRPNYHVPHQKGVVGKAANFVFHVADLMNGNSHSGAT